MDLTTKTEIENKLKIISNEILKDYTSKTNITEELKQKIERELNNIISEYNDIESFKINYKITSSGVLRLKIKLIPKKSGSRKLVTIRKINNLELIENADRIVLATIDGWKCIVSKDDFKIGDYGVYFEIDSFLPLEEKYDFLKSKCYKKFSDGREGLRIKTMKMKGVLSQGLLLPLYLFPELDDFELFEGMDLTKELNVELYNPPLPVNLKGLVKGTLPWYIKKTDQERIQNLPEYFNEFKDVDFEITEKLDGTSVTYYFYNGCYGVCSRNLEFDTNDTDNLYVKTGNELDIKNILENISFNIALQGEIVGIGIQKNPLKLNNVQFRLFDIWDIDEQRYWTSKERLLLLEKINKDRSLDKQMLHVPILETKKIFSEIDNMNDLLFYAEGKTVFESGVEREGLVFKSTKLINGQTITFKVISNKYLLNEK